MRKLRCEPAMGSKAGTLRTLVGLAALAIAARALYLYDSRDYPAYFAPIVDADRYDALAHALAQRWTDQEVGIVAGRHQAFGEFLIRRAGRERADQLVEDRTRRRRRCPSTLRDMSRRRRRPDR